MAAVLIDDERRRRLLVDRQVLGPAGRAARTVADVTGTLALLHSTDPTTPYLSVHARAAVSVGDIEAALYDDRTLLRHTTLRRTVFAMPLDVVPLAHGAYNGRLVAALRKNLLTWIDASPDTDRPAAEFLAELEREVVDHLRSTGPATGAALAQAIPGLRVRFEVSPGASYSGPMRITSKVLELVAAEGRIARGRPTGRGITSGSWTWEPADRWVGPGGIDPIPAAEATAGLVARYLAAFGPATVTDIAWWTGLPKTVIRAALSAAGTLEVRVSGVAEPGFVVADDDLATDSPEGVVALLPGLDSTTMGWKQRSWYVDDAAATGLFDRNGNAGPTIWVDGRVVGTWTQRADGTIATSFTEPIGSAERDEIDREIDRLVDWLGDTRIKWRYPTPLTRRLDEA